ncbi:MAG TPA: hypothetical protein VHB21_26230 [Minicystis sp.]|nr:hypothetical protein [Minicystis sp.]
MTRKQRRAARRVGGALVTAYLGVRALGAFRTAARWIAGAATRRRRRRSTGALPKEAAHLTALERFGMYADLELAREERERLRL